MGIQVQVCIPHFFNESQRSVENYGSCREGSRLARSLALARCLSSVIALRRSQIDFELNIGDRAIDSLPQQDSIELGQKIPANVEVTVCTTGGSYLRDVLSLYETKISMLNLDLENPRHLGLATRDHLIHHLPSADLFIYLEDDLVIHDGLYLEKLFWFYSQTKHQMCLMPHRYEMSSAQARCRLYVDGPPSAKAIQKFIKPRHAAAEGRFQGQVISFDVASNPHSGSFCMSLPQVKQLRKKSLPTSGFAGPLETAATYTVMKYYPILKSSKKHIDFFEIEHAHPSFLGHFNSFPVRNASSNSSVHPLDELQNLSC
jgi:hypothetical protein